MKFYVKDSSGEVVRFGDCLEETFEFQAEDGETVYEGDPVLKPLPELYDTSYSGSRRREYPPIGDQLDMIWHSMNNGSIEKSEPFYSSIKQVKDLYPKE